MQPHSPKLVHQIISKFYLINIHLTKAYYSECCLLSNFTNTITLHYSVIYYVLHEVCVGMVSSGVLSSEHCCQDTIIGMP